MTILFSAADAAALRSLLRQPWHFERAPVVRWLLRLLAPLAAVGPLIAWTRTGNPETTLLAAAAPLVVLAFGCWVTAVRALALQNTPVNAMLVPRARRLSMLLVPL